MTESEIQHAILKKWGALPGLRIWRTNTGRANIGGRWVQFNHPGTPDITGIIKVNGLGVALGIEVKTAKGKQSDDQVAMQKTYNSLGAIYILARSVADVDAVLLPLVGLK